MECRECESVLIDYLFGELDGAELSECRKHLDSCPRCRESAKAYGCIADRIMDEPTSVPTTSEAASLAKALSAVSMVAAFAPRPASRPPQGLLGFVLASVLAFLAIAVTAGLQAFGHIDLMSVAESIGAPRLALAATIVIFVTSFIPVVVATRRRPVDELNFGVRS